MREEVALAGHEEGRRLFTYTHLPPGEAAAALVICSPLHAEFLHNYRKEVLLGRSLAEAGIAVRRFHYRGTGNSEGEAVHVTFDSMLDDAVAVAESFAATADLGRLAFLGTRIGGLIASATARRFDGAPLILWEPVTDPSVYFREVFRAAAIRELRDDLVRRSAAAAGKGAVTVKELESVGVADVLGYSVHRTLYRSLLDRRLPEEIGERPRAVLLLQLDRRDALKREYAALVDGLRSSGFAVHARVVRADDHWWFSGDPAEAASTLRAAVGATTTWLHEVIGPGAA